MGGGFAGTDQPEGGGFEMGLVSMAGGGYSLLSRMRMGGSPIHGSSWPVISLQSHKDQGSTSVISSESDLKPRKRICCACPDTKKLRDECVVEHGESACEKWIEAHKKCLRAEGFNI
ncbi:hypothetical protein OROGR_000161 [Orobanche gracilis]